MKATLSLTHRCNLACRYCYAGRSSAPDMPLETGRTIIDFVLSLCAPGAPLRVHFFGGEPLLCLDLIQELSAYLRQRAQLAGVPYTLAITSNGTILSDRVLRFLSDEHVELCLSIDGAAATHDHNRYFRNRRGSHAVVIANLRRALEALEDVQVNAVFGPENIAALEDNVRFLIDQGARIIHLNPNITADWSSASLELAEQAFSGVGRVYLECYQRGYEIAIAPIESKIVLFLKGGYSFEDLCCMGAGELAFAPSGNIYPCERFIGDDQDARLRIGTVTTGFDVAQRRFIAQQRGNRNSECQACHFRPYCMNWCGCTNCAMTGSVNLVGPAMCAIERAVIRAAQHVFTTLSEQGNTLFHDHMLQYTHSNRAAIRADTKGDRLQ